jgi:hypothetical protein
VAGRLVALGLTGLASLITGRLSALGSTGVARLIARIASFQARIPRTRIALGPASVATGAEARIAACAKTRLCIESSAAAATLGSTRSSRFRPEALLGHATSAAQANIEIELIASGSCFVRARNSSRGGDLRIFLNEDACATQTSERRLVRRKLLAMDNVLFANLDT